MGTCTGHGSMWMGGLAAIVLASSVAHAGKPGRSTIVPNTTIGDLDDLGDEGGNAFSERYQSNVTFPPGTTEANFGTPGHETVYVERAGGTVAVRSGVSDPANAQWYSVDNVASVSVIERKGKNMTSYNSVPPGLWMSGQQHGGELWNAIVLNQNHTVGPPGEGNGFYLDSMNELAYGVAAAQLAGSSGRDIVIGDAGILTPTLGDMTEGGMTDDNLILAVEVNATNRGVAPPLLDATTVVRFPNDNSAIDAAVVNVNDVQYANTVGLASYANGIGTNAHLVTFSNGGVTAVEISRTGYAPMFESSTFVNPAVTTDMLVDMTPTDWGAPLFLHNELDAIVPMVGVLSAGSSNGTELLAEAFALGISTIQVSYAVNYEYYETSEIVDPNTGVIIHSYTVGKGGDWGHVFWKSVQMAHNGTMTTVTVSTAFGAGQHLLSYDAGHSVDMANAAWTLEQTEPGFFDLQYQNPNVDPWVLTDTTFHTTGAGWGLEAFDPDYFTTAAPYADSYGTDPTADTCDQQYACKDQCNVTCYIGDGQVDGVCAFECYLDCEATYPCSP